ncbi:MAG: hypothetical protein HY329_27385 [Chloroflexi bacterium]|nr:hypothetical protein [Chloroflexota bacterium]
MALDTRDPLVIRKTADRCKTLLEVLDGLDDDVEVDPKSMTVGVSQAARALGFTAWQIRQMIREGKLPARKLENEWRIALGMVL